MEEVKFKRTTEGLRDALMSEMEDLRNAKTSPAEAREFSLLAERVIKSLEIDLAREAFEERKKRATQEQERALLEITLKHERRLKKIKVLEITHGQ